MTAIEIELNRFRGSTDAVRSYTDAKNGLLRSGILGILRQFARPFTRDNGANPYSAAYSAGVSEGYNRCLDDLIYFEEIYLTNTTGKKNVSANFGGYALAEARGDLTKAETERLKGGK